MNKKLLILCLLLIPLTVSAQSKNLGREITLHVGYIDPRIETNSNPKAPMRIPSLYTDGNTLYFDGAWHGYTLMLYKDDVLAYSGIVQSDSLYMLSVLDDLDGDIEIVLESGSRKFYGTL